ncbi:transposase [Ideonella dechloratans]|uniref:Transposase n=1 Tax=Ideonella dechloratans TaxID=36863 RepID=A0A643F7N3_IDEDE|nr:transposase [Ideonella dechloratans]
MPELMQRFGCSQRNALRIVGMSCSTYLYESKRRDEAALKLRIKEITQTRVHYGYRRVHVLLRREGYRDNVKRIYRLYREQGLSLRLKRPKRNKTAQWRQPVTDRRNGARDVRRNGASFWLLNRAPEGLRNGVILPLWRGWV